MSSLSEGPYQSGNPITLQASFVEPNGTSPIDPSTVVFNIRDADDQLTIYTYGVDSNVYGPGDTPPGYSIPLGTGTYVCLLPTDWLPGQSYYEAVATNPDVTLPGEFYIIPSSVIPPVQAPGPKMPPCTAWIAGEDLGQCVNIDDYDAVTRDEIAVISSMLLYEASGRRFSGLCGPVTVRPCKQPCSVGAFTGGWSWSWGFWANGDWGYDWYWGNESGGRLCSCGYDSTVDLAGYPVSEILEVKIGGQVLAPTFTDGSPQYRLDQWRYLTRLSDPANRSFPLHWPNCQRLDLEDDQPGTWSVKYRYGVAPPPAGVEAAKQLACQLLLAKAGKPCQLPSNVSQVVRQGSRIERITPLADMVRKGATGLTFVDLFVGLYNPAGLKRAPSVFSPDTPFPVRVGNE